MTPREELLIKSYERCFEEKHHYDRLSWTIGSLVFLACAAIITGIFNIKPDGVVEQTLRLSLAALSVPLLLFWINVYERNRFWGEAANERARDIEKELGVNGIGHALMEAALDGQVTLKNTSITAEPHKGRTPHTEKVMWRSMHFGVRAIAFFALLAIVAVAALPIFKL